MLKAALCVPQRAPTRCIVLHALRPFVRRKHALHSIKPLQYLSTTTPGPSAVVQRTPSHPLAYLFNQHSTLFDEPASPKVDQELLQFIHNTPNLVDFFSCPKKVHALAQCLAKSRTPAYAPRILQLAVQRECHLKDDAFESVSFSLADSKHWEMVLKVVEVSKSIRGRLSVRLLNWRARSLLETRKFAELPLVLNEFAEAKLQPNRRTYHLLLSGHLRNNDLDSTRECLRTMHHANIPPDASTHVLIVKQYRNFGPVHSVRQKSLALLPTLPVDSGVIVLNSLIRSSLDINDLPTARFLTDHFEPPSTNLFLAALSCPFPDRPSPHTKIPGLVPNATTYSIIVNFATKRGDYHSAAGLLNTFSTSGQVVTHDIVAAALNLYFSSKKAEKAAQLFAQLCAEASVAPEIYEAFSSQPSSSQPVLVTSNVPLNTRICNAMLQGALNNSADVRPILAIMSAAGLQWNNITVDILLRHLREASDLSSSDLLSTLQNLTRSPSNASMIQLHKIFGRIVEEEKAVQRRQARASSKAKTSSEPTTPASSAVATVWDPFDPLAGMVVPPSQDRAGEDLRHFISMLDPGLKSDSPTFAQRIQVEAVLNKDIAAAEEVFNTMRERGFFPNEYHYNALVEGFALAGKYRQALKTIEIAERSGIKMGVVAYTILISSFGKRRLPRLASRTFRWMLEQNVKPNFRTIDALVQAFCHVGWLPRARWSLLRLWPMVAPLPEGTDAMNLKELRQRFRSLDPQAKAKGQLTRDEATEISSVFYQNCVDRNQR